MAKIVIAGEIKFVYVFKLHGLVWFIGFEHAQSERLFFYLSNDILVKLNP